MSLKPKKVSEKKREQAKLNEKMKRKKKVILDDIPLSVEINILKFLKDTAIIKKYL